jgi:AraC-like DNA-binding protein
MKRLNESAAGPMAWDDAVRPPRWYLWDGGFLVMGQAGGEVPCHAHHAIQVSIAFAGSMAVRPDGGDWREARGVIMRADVEHAVDFRDCAGATLFVDPESAEGAWLASALTEGITRVPDCRVERCAGELRRTWESPIEGMEASELIRHCLQALCPGAVPSRRLDPRIAAVLERARAADDLRLSLDAAAAAVHLSAGRFAHLFKEQLGLPFSRYMLWRKVTRAMLAMGSERTLAAAAQRGDFADAAHFTRTFLQHFGMPPSVLMRGEFLEIPPPFTAA